MRMAVGNGDVGAGANINKVSVACAILVAFAVVQRDMVKREIVRVKDRDC